VTQIHCPREGRTNNSALTPYVQPRGEIHNFNPSALDLRPPKTTAPDPQNWGGSPLPFDTMGRPGVLPLMGTDYRAVTALNPVQPRSEIYNIHPIAPVPQTPKNDRTGPPKIRVKVVYFTPGLYKGSGQLWVLPMTGRTPGNR